jgi:hypothetical protein
VAAQPNPERRVVGQAVLVLDDDQVGINAEDHLVEWLLEGDPAVRWRVLRDFAAATEQQVRRERARVATDGWGARLLAEQDADGGWGGGPYAPKWTSTTYTLLHLMWLGIAPGQPATLRGCERLWQWRARWRVPETCIVAMLIRLTSAHGYQTDRLDDLVGHLLGQQLADGGWNCAARGDKNKHSSFHTTILALEALDDFARSGGRVDATEASLRGREFFLAHRLYQSHRTGAIAIRGSTRFPAFPEWHFDVLRGLEYFATADYYDERLRDAVEVLCRARRKDGRWSTYARYPGRYWFTLEPTGPSRWNTARALRVLEWWSAHTANRVRSSVPDLGAPVGPAASANPRG